MRGVALSTASPPGFRHGTFQGGFSFAIVLFVSIVLASVTGAAMSALMSELLQSEISAVTPDNPAARRTSLVMTPWASNDRSEQTAIQESSFQLKEWISTALPVLAAASNAL
jgi:hypothetical protein